MGTKGVLLCLILPVKVCVAVQICDFGGTRDSSNGLLSFFLVALLSSLCVWPNTVLVTVYRF